ncbi:MAG: dihydropteroate synthase [Candidatus Omnitrophica bacterium]|nr:dihydropteroate synthase [Candidatus Omnitrophota bacterium]
MPDWLIKDKVFDLTRPRIMGILNLTPDSFSGDGLYPDRQKAFERAFLMEEEGADIIDIGAESTRPGSPTVSESEELKRLMPVLEKICAKIRIPISVDTNKSKVAAEALKTGATIINDITAGGDRRILELAAENKAGLVLMHMQGTPATMQENPSYRNVIAEISQFLAERIAEAKKYGVSEKQIVIDPGVGFGKTLEHNLTILKNLDYFAKLSRPILVGLSRKGFIGQITGLGVNERLEGTIAAVVAAYLSGSAIFRVHDVKAVKRALAIAEAIKNANSGN